MISKKSAAVKAVEYIRDGMIVGLGTGSTTFWAIQKIAERIADGLNIKAVASSKNSEELAEKAGIQLVAFSEIEIIDIVIDGADEIDKEHYLIKGGGGALLREKILAANTKQFIVIADQAKLVDKLGRFPLPVEIVPFASNLTVSKLSELKCQPRIRMVNDKNFITDNGNLIVDCSFGDIIDPSGLDMKIRLIPGVVETGLFMKSLVSLVIIGYEDGSVRIQEG